MRGLILKQAGSTLANTTTIPKLEDGQGPILGFVDGLNLYAYLKHNPLMAFDSYGLEGEAYRDLLKWPIILTFMQTFRILVGKFNGVQVS